MLGSWALVEFPPKAPPRGRQVEEAKLGQGLHFFIFKENMGIFPGRTRERGRGERRGEREGEAARAPGAPRGLLWGAVQREPASLQAPGGRVVGWGAERGENGVKRASGRQKPQEENPPRESGEGAARRDGQPG